jgi:hypothetical protein
MNYIHVLTACVVQVETEQQADAYLVSTYHLTRNGKFYIIGSMVEYFGQKEMKDSGLLGYDAVISSDMFPTFRRKIMPTPSKVKEFNKNSQHTLNGGDVHVWCNWLAHGQKTPTGYTAAVNLLYFSRVLGLSGP